MLAKKAFGESSAGVFFASSGGDSRRFVFTEAARNAII